MNELLVSIKRMELYLKIDELYLLYTNRANFTVQYTKKAQVAQLVERNFEAV